MADFPGYRFASTVAGAWVEALGQQGDIVKTAWSEILAGTYDHKALMRDNAQLYQSQVGVLTSVLSATRADPLNVPSWLTLDATQEPPSLQSLSGTVQTRAYKKATGNLTASDLAAFSSSMVRFHMTPDVLTDPPGIKVTIDSVSYTVQSKVVTLPLDTTKQVIDAFAVIRAYGLGPHLGLIYDQRGGTSAPLAVVTLMI